MQRNQRIDLNYRFVKVFFSLKSGSDYRAEQNCKICRNADFVAIKFKIV